MEQEKETQSSNVFLSVHSVANRYDVHENTVWHWARIGKFPQPVKLGVRCTRWRLSDLEAWEKKESA